MFRHKLEDARRFLSQKAQACFVRVMHKNDVAEVSAYLREHPRGAVSVNLTPEQDEHIQRTYKQMCALLDRNGIDQEKGFQRLEGHCVPGELIKLTSSFRGSASHVLVGDELDTVKDAQQQFLQAYREAVEPAFENHPFTVAYVPVTRGGTIHRDFACFRFATYSPTDPEQTTEYPGIRENQRAPANSVLFFGEKFWHASPISDRPVLVAECFPD